ncbi:MAG: 23S rRNA (guanosine(2251)-2'-O)-methyltransferase RlmB [Clostridia bacterium]|nr:23S rRNA (guanosine(2251)-2'-O)-methyltransferase RlmB [Clostridia bacterium]
MEYRSSPKRGKEAYTAEDEARTATAVGGRNAVRELLASGRDIDKIFVARGDREGSITTLIAEARRRSIPVLEVDRRKLDALCGHDRHQGIAACAAMVEYRELDDLFALAEQRGEPPFFVVCDGIEDPHNLGAILRSAECCGAHGLILQKRRSAGITPVVAKASAGAVTHLPIVRVTNLACTLDTLRERGVWVTAADMNGTSYEKLDYRGATALVMGSEGFGISRLVLEKCDFVASIPLYGKVNSMNVSAAAAVLLCEIARQRHIT